MSYHDLVLEMLKNDLSAPRVLLAQVVDYINDHYTYPSNQLRQFFAEKYPQLEDYEVDLTFSPQYTPSEHNRLEYIPLLGAKALSVSEVALLKQQLEEARLETRFSTADDPEEMTVPVHEVFIERYVNLLKLDWKLHEGAYQHILDTVPTDSHHEVNLLAREDVWRVESRYLILAAFLQLFHELRNFSTIKVSFLTNFVRTYRPTGLLDVPRQLESLILSCTSDMENVERRGFHDEYLKSLNTGNTLAQPNARDVWAHYKHMIEMAEQLKADYAQLERLAPDFLRQAQACQPV